MSSLAKTFKKVGSKTATKTVRKVATSEQSEERARINIQRKKAKARVKQHRKEEKEEKAEYSPALAEFNRDSQTRRSIEDNIFQYLQDYTNEHPTHSSDRNKSRGEFPLLYNNLKYEKPFTSSEIAQLASDPRLQRATYSHFYLLPDRLAIQSVLGERKSEFRSEPINIIESLEIYNALLEKHEYSVIRSEILELIDSFSQIKDRPVFAEDILRNDQLFSAEDINELVYEYSLPDPIIDRIREYNNVLGREPHIVESIQLSQIEQERTYDEKKGEDEAVDESKLYSSIVSAPQQLKDMRAALVRAREASDKAALKAEQEEQKEVIFEKIKPAISSGDVTGQVKRHVTIYKQAIKVEISDDEKQTLKISGQDQSGARDPNDIPDEEVNIFLLRRHNLPYWIFMASFVSKPVSPDNTRRLLGEYPEIATQFSNLFRRLSVDKQLEFISLTFSQYPIQEYPTGPDIPILTLLIQFYNISIEWDPTTQHLGIDTQLATIPADRFGILFKSLSPAQLIRFRDIVFGRLSEIDQELQTSILVYYSAFLVPSTSILVYNEFGSEADPLYLLSPERISIGSFKTNLSQLVTIDSLFEGDKKFNQLIYTNLFQDSRKRPKILCPDEGRKHFEYLDANTNTIISDPSLNALIEAMQNTIDYSKLEADLVDTLNKIDSSGTYEDNKREAQRLVARAKFATLADYIIQVCKQPTISGVYVEAEGSNHLPTFLDFIVPFNQGTKDDIERYLKHNLPGLLESINLSRAPSPAQIEDIIIPRYHAGPVNLLVYARLVLERYYSANLPVQSEFDVFLRELISQICSDVISNKTISVDDIGDIPILVPDNIVEDLSAKLTKTREDDRLSVSAIDLQTQASKLGFNMNIGLEMAKPQAVAKLKARLRAREITRSEYDETIKQIDELMDAYAILGKKRGGTDIDIKTKRRRVDKLVKDKIQELEGEAREHGEYPNKRDLEEQAKQYLIESGEIKAEDLSSTDLSGRALAPIRAAKSVKTRNELQAVIKNMPDALKHSLQSLLDSISDNIKLVQDAKKLETTNYYKFVTSVIIWNQNATKDSRMLEDIQEEYSRRLPPAFIKKIINMLRTKGVTGSDLIRETAIYTRAKTSLVKNPLARQRIRRKRRYDELFTTISGSGSLTAIRKNLPETLAPHLKECLAAHQLKPWLNIPNINKWMFLIANANGLQRDQMSEKERIYFSVQSQNQVILVLANDTKLYFYRPTTAYWLMHCQLHHKDSDTITCSVDNLTKTFSTSSSSARFYELMLLPPIETSSQGNNIISYSKDTDKVIFLSNDKSVYERECAWFKNRYTAIEDQIDILRGKIMVGDIARTIRNMAQQEIKTLLGLLRIKFGMTGDQELTDDTIALEQALYDNLRENGEGFNVYTYLKELFSLLIFLDLTEPLGKESKFFTSLVAQSSRAYYQTLLIQFPDQVHRFPEIFLLDAGEEHDRLKQDVRAYIDQKVNLLVDQAITRLIGKSVPMSMQSSISALLTKQSGDITAAFPSFSGLTLKNVCENGQEYEGMQDSWLMYYVSGDKAYCISKLQLANMAQTKNYTFKGIRFDQSFVDSFALYSEFAANEIRSRESYIKEIISSLVELPENNQLLSELSVYRNSFGNLNQDDLERAGIFGKIKSIADKDDAYLVMIITNRLNDVLDEYSSAIIRELSTQFIKQNRERLLSVINDTYSTYRNKDLLSSVLPSEKILDPAADIVVRYVTDITLSRVSDKDRQYIIYLVSELVHGEPSVAHLETAECATCKAAVHSAQLEASHHLPEQIPEQSYKTVAQVRSGLETETKYLKFCSSKCFSKYKISEPSRDDVDLARLQIAVNKVTQPYLDYTQMTHWARFPHDLNLPTDPERLNSIIASFSKIKGIPEDEIREVLPSLTRTENALGIFTTDEKGVSLSQTELWDRIRVHPLFVPSIVELLTQDRYEALVYLAKKFNVPIYSSDWDEAEGFYTADPEELRNVWKELRARSAFEKLLFSTVKTFDASKGQVIGIGSFSTKGEGTSLATFFESTHVKPGTANLDHSVFTDIDRFIRTGVQTIPDLANYLANEHNFKNLRNDIIIKVGNQFSKALTFDRKKKFRILNFRKALEQWFETHRRAVITKTPVVADFEADKTKHILSSDELIRELQNFCNDNVKEVLRFPIPRNANDVKTFLRLAGTYSRFIDNFSNVSEPLNRLIEKENAKWGWKGEQHDAFNRIKYEIEQAMKITSVKFSRWTTNLIKNNENPFDMRFNIDYYPIVMQEFQCSTLQRIQNEYIEFVFNIEKVNSIIDNIFADVINEQQQRRVEPRPAHVYQKKRWKNLSATQEHKEENIDSLLDRLTTSNIPSLEVIETTTLKKKDRQTILREIENMRKRLGEVDREKKKSALSRTIVWKTPENDLAQDIEQAFEEQYSGNEAVVNDEGLGEDAKEPLTEHTEPEDFEHLEQIEEEEPLQLEDELTINEDAEVDIEEQEPDYESEPEYKDESENEEDIY